MRKDDVDRLIELRQADKVINNVQNVISEVTPDVDDVNMTPDRVDETAKGEHMIDCTDEQLMEEVRRRGFVIRDAQIGREWVGLTDEDIDLYALDIGVTANKAPSWLIKYARDIEAKLKEKNT